MVYRPGTDGCLSLFAQAYATGILVFPRAARVLEIGCAEADWMTPMLAERPDLQITGIDWRDCASPTSATVIKGDVLAQRFSPETFDAIVGISSIEHIGLGHYDNDPIDPDGDCHAMVLAQRWLRPGGWIYADVPYETDGFRVEGTSHRVYGHCALSERLTPSGLDLQRVWFGTDSGRLHDAPPTDRSHLMLYAACLWRKMADG